MRYIVLMTTHNARYDRARNARKTECVWLSMAHGKLRKAKKQSILANVANKYVVRVVIFVIVSGVDVCVLTELLA